MSLELIVNNGPDVSKLTGIECEQALLAALIKDNTVYEQIFKILKPQYFSFDVYGELYKKIARSIDEGRTIDIVTLKNHFECNETLKELGGVDYLVDLSDSFVSFSNCVPYAQHLQNLYFNRAVTQICHRKGSHVCANPDSNAFENMEDLQQEVFKLRESGILEEDGSLESSVNRVLKNSEEAFKTGGNSTKIKTCFSEIDKLTGGFKSPQLIIIAGRPSMGKSSLALNMAYNMARASLNRQQGGGAVGFFSIEMSSDDLITRMIAEETGITSDRIENGHLDSAEEFDRMIRAGRDISLLPLEIFENDLSLAAIRMSARQMKRKRGLDIIIIDYLQLIKSAEDANYQNRTQEITTITAGLKALAKELKIPIIALSQLSRQTEGRENKRPQLSDLRDSGSIEQDADIVGFVYREEYYASRNRPSDDDFKALTEWKLNMNQIKDKAEFIIAKNRSGKTGTANLCFDASLTKFSDGDAK